MIYWRNFNEFLDISLKPIVKSIANAEKDSSTIGESFKNVLNVMKDLLALDISNTFVLISIRFTISTRKSWLGRSGAYFLHPTF